MLRHPLRTATAVAVVLAVAGTLPAVWWRPLHGDELVTIDFSPRPLGRLVDDVFVERGGAPVYFFVEHVALSWPGGLEGLRLPSLVFFLLALPAAVLVGRELLGIPAAAALAPLLALAPLAVEIATFGRMYALFLSTFLWALVLVLRAARLGGPERWALGGALLGALAYVHPTAPLYGVVALGAATLVAGAKPRRLAREAGVGLAALVVVQIPYYAIALGVLRDRYDVVEGGPLLGTQRTSGRSIPESALYAFTPGGGWGALVVGLLAVAGLAWLGFRSPRVALALALWTLVPLAFFSLVPAQTFFFNRYLVPSLPAFLLLVVAGSLALASVVRRRQVAVAAALVAAVSAWQGFDAADRLRELEALGVQTLVEEVAEERDDALVFFSTGTRGLASPNGLDELLVLELGVERAREATAANLVRAFEAAPEPRVGFWAFGGAAARVSTAEARVAEIEGVAAVRISPLLLLVRSLAPERPRTLVAQALAVRQAWSDHGPDDRRADRLIAVDQAALERME